MFLINIIGCDGAGKTTVIDHLTEWLRNKYGRTVEPVSKLLVLDHQMFPECKFINCPQDELRNCISMMEKQSRFLFFVYLYTTALMKIDTYTEKDKIVFLDGYWYKHYVSEALFGNDKEWMKNVCSFLPKPDLTILFDVDSSISYERKSYVSRYECGLSDTTKENYIRFQEIFRAQLKKLASEEEWLIIDANADLEKVLSTTKKVVLEYVNSQKMHKVK